MKVSTIILLNPDYGLENFLKKDGGYENLNQFCSHITLYGDRNVC